MTKPDVQKYIAAFQGILTPDELQKAEAEKEEFADDLPPFKDMSGLVRHTIGRLAESKKAGLISSDSAKADKKGRDYSAVVGEVFDSKEHKKFKNEPDADSKKDYVSKLNYQTFILSDDGMKLRHAKNAQEVSDLFPPGDEKNWSTLILVSNSDLVSPQSFFDSFEAAKKIIPAVTDLDADHIVVAGTYFSQRHLHANSVDTFARYRELGVNPISLRKVKPAAEVQAYQILDLLLERDTDGAVIVEGNKPLLRADSAKVLSHVVGYGYSSAHMTNKDAFRALRDILAGGDVQVQVRQDGKLVVRDSTAADAERLISQAKLIGVAGMDRMDLGQEKGMPREINFISPKDFSHALNGPRYLKAPNVITIRMKDDKGSPIKDSVGGHAQDSYVEAILAYPNSWQREQANVKLDRLNSLI